MTRLGALEIAACAMMALLACTNDYGKFVFVGATQPADGGPGEAAVEIDASGGEDGAGEDGAGEDGAGEDGAGEDGAGGAADGDASSDAIADAQAEPVIIDALEEGGCPGGYKPCGGACAPVDSAATGCGGKSCDPCPSANGTATCLGGACAVACHAGFANCDGDLSNGCEQSTSDSPSQCGACNRACASDNVASLSCAAGACTSTCKAGHDNCNMPATGPDDGCERNVTSSNTSCGSCANDCTKQGGGLVCAGGTCGCTDNAQCHVTGNGTFSCDTATGKCVCSGSACAPGEACTRIGNTQVCTCNGKTACASGRICCQTPAGCQDLDADPANCGACGRACPSGWACVAGACACDGDNDCNSGSFGTCSGGLCSCGGTTCGAEQRCMANGTCG